MSCKIFLDDSVGYYSPGSIVKAKVECDFGQSTTLRSLIIRFQCQEHIGWVEGKVIFSHDNILIREEHYLLFGDSPIQRTGVQVFPFFFILPLKLPSSYRSDLGFVEYSLKAIIDVPFWKNATNTLTLYVHAPIMFNTGAADYPRHTFQSTEKPSGLCCYKNGTFAMDVELPTTAFVLDETVNFRVNIRNSTPSNVDCLKIVLKQKITYGPPQVAQRTKVVKREIVNLLINSGVAAYDEHSFDLSFTLRAINPIFNFNGCTLIEVDYYLKAICELPFNCKKFYVKVPVRIGFAKCNLSNMTNIENLVHLSSPFSYVVFPPGL